LLNDLNVASFEPNTLGHNDPLYTVRDESFHKVGGKIDRVGITNAFTFLVKNGYM